MTMLRGFSILVCVVVFFHSGLAALASHLA
jgi:hypothetical protein